MANKEIGSLTPAGTVDVADLLHLIQSGNSRKATVQQLVTLLGTLYQPLDSDLTAIAALSTTSFGRSFLTLANAAAVTALLDTASDANVRASAASKLFTTGLIESASALVTLTETAGAVAVDWDTFINGEVTVDQATVISNPTNGQPGTTRTIMVKGNNSTDRTITFGNQFLGEVPTITDCDSDRWYLLTIHCHTASHFVVSSKRSKG